MAIESIGRIGGGAQAAMAEMDGLSMPSRQAMARFEDAMRSAAGRHPGEAMAPAVQPLTQTGAEVKVAQVGGALPAQTTDPLSASERALQVFEPQAAPGAANGTTGTGDTILEGLRNLRGAFDEQASSLGALQKNADVTSSQLLGLQVEVVKYSLLIDVTSKLTGKSTQAFDTLLKGQ